MVNNILPQIAKYKTQHVEKVDADVGGYTPGFRARFLFQDT